MHRGALFRIEPVCLRQTNIASAESGFYRSAVTEVLPKKTKHPTGRPSRDEAVRRIEHLLKVAADLFFEEGFHATSMERIAKAAGIGDECSADVR